MGNSENLKSFIKENKRLLREYIETKVQLFKLRFVRLFSNMAGHLIWILLCLFLFWLFIVFLALVTGFWLSDITGSYPLGFGITTLGILLLLIGFVFWGRKALVNFVIRKIIAGAAHQLNLKEESGRELKLYKMEARKNIHNIETLEREIYRLKAESRRMEKDLNDHFDHFRENYKSYFMNSFFKRKHEKAKERQGLFSSFFGQEAFQSAMEKIANQLADRISNVMDSIVDKIFGKKK